MNQVNYFICCPSITFKLEPERDSKLILGSGGGVDKWMQLYHSAQAGIPFFQGISGLPLARE